MAKRVTLREIAAKASVSYQTVSKVINHNADVSEETRQRVFAAIEEMNYTPNYTARSLRSQRSKTIGYTWEPSPPDQANPILDEFLQSMFRAAEKQGYYLLCFPYHAEIKQQLDVYKELIDSGRVDAFVLSIINYNDPCVNYLLERGFPFVGFGHLDDSTLFPNIDVDGGLGLHMAVDHILSRGHQKIAALAWPKDSRVGNQRLAGYIAAMQEAGIEILPEWIKRSIGTYEEGFKSTSQLLRLPESIRPSAFVALNDLMAIGAMDAIAQHGLKPGQDVLVTGFDDTPTARFLTPSLTSLRQPVSRIGETLIERLIIYLETGHYPQPFAELIPPELVIRESTSGIKYDLNS
jgi:DNA-binding LacI/PurR family transcriptional regulator